MRQREEGRSFPFIPSQQPVGDEWMTEEQETVTTIYGWAAVVAIGLVCFMYLQGWMEQITQFLCGASIVRHASNAALSLYLFLVCPHQLFGRLFHRVLWRTNVSISATLQTFRLIFHKSPATSSPTLCLSVTWME